MGFHEVSRVLERSKATGYERLAIVALAHRVNDERGDGAAWPGMDTFAADVNCSERFIQKIVKGWRLAPHEIYVIDGGGRHNPNCYVVLVGCTFAEIVRRLMVNLKITEQQAEKLAGECGYQKGEHYDMSTAATTGNGEHYDTETVNITTPKGEHYAETVNTCSPEQELNINLEPQSDEPQLHSLPSPASPNPSAATPTNETGNIIPFSSDEPLVLKALCELCGISGPNASKRARATLQKLAAMTPGGEAPPNPRDFIRFRYYMKAVNARPKPPTLAYVEDGWGRYLEWFADPHGWTARYWRERGWPKGVSREQLLNAHDLMAYHPALMEVAE